MAFSKFCDLSCDWRFSALSMHNFRSLTYAVSENKLRDKQINRLTKTNTFCQMNETLNGQSYSVNLFENDLQTDRLLDK